MTHPSNHRTRRRINRLTAGAFAIVLATTACKAGNGEEPEPVPPETSTSTPTETPTATPTKDPDAWRSKFKPAQLKAYDAALQRWEEYEARSEPLWAKGEATPAAEKLFKEYFPHPIWRTQFEQLQTYEQYEVQIAGTPDILWSRARRISDSGSGVVIVQCVDYRSTTTTQHGKPTTPIKARQKPVLREINLSRPQGYDWLIYGINATPGAGGKKDEPCNPTA